MRFRDTALRRERSRPERSAEHGGPGPVAPQTANQSIYIIPDPPGDNRYSLLFDSVDGVKKQRLFVPNAKVTARGNDQIQQADVELTDLTFTCYPGTIGANTAAVAQRYLDFGNPMTTYFT